MGSLTRLKVVSALLILASLLTSKAAVVDFEVTGRTCGGPSNSVTESFLLTLSNPADIQQAREMITNAASSKAPVFSVEAGSDGINRNFSDATKTLWSWHAIRFWGFTDALPPENWPCSPSQLETNWDEWFAMSKGVVGFLNYAVVAEFGPALELSVQTNSPSEGITIAWPDVSTNVAYTVQGTNVVYTLQFTDSLTATNWTSVPGGNWPLRTNQWTDPAPAAVTRFYRVKTEVSGP